jgi:hypothetical protein
MMLVRLRMSAAGSHQEQQGQHQILSIDRKEDADEQHSRDRPNGSTQHGFSGR